jgi:hypothetical protein
MATSNPTPAESLAAPAHRREAIDTISGQIAAIDELIGLATLSIRVFDIDLSTMGWNTVERVDRLAAFLRSSRKARLEVIVHDVRYLESRAARLRNLHRNYSGVVTLCQTGATSRHALDPMVLVDARHYLHRFHIDRPRAALGIEELQEAQLLSLRFDEIWASREGEIPATTLGL